VYLKNYNELKRVHDVIYLARKLHLSQELIDLCMQLSNIYIETRYPDASGKIPAKKFSQSDAQNFIKIVSEILQWLQRKL
jgi:HEPN domain-containing protein